MGELAHLPAVERAIGDGDAQHVGVKLQVDAVHQPQRLELVLGDLADRRRATWSRNWLTRAATKAWSNSS
jgi:hypothetical protein